MGFRYQPVVRHARFVYSPYTSDEMLGFGELLADTIRQRIQSGVNIYDQEAAARILQCNRKTLGRRLPELIDELSEAFLKAGLLERLPETKEEAL